MGAPLPVPFPVNLEAFSWPKALLMWEEVQSALLKIPIVQWHSYSTAPLGHCLGRVAHLPLVAYGAMKCLASRLALIVLQIFSFLGISSLF